MKKSLVERELRREMTVGGFAFLVVLALFVFSIFVTGEVLLGKKQRFEILFKDVMGLRKGDGVVVRGMSVGEVKKLELVPGQGLVRVSCALRQPVALKTDYEAKIVPTSVLGGRHLEISEGTNTAALSEDAVVSGKTPRDLMEDAGAVIAQFRRTVEGGALDDAAQALASIRHVAEKIERGEGTIGMLINDKTAYEDLKGALADLHDVTRQVRSGSGTLGKILYDDTMYNDVASTVGNLKDITQSVKDNKGLLGKLVSDESLARDVQAAVANVRDISQSMKDGKGTLGKLMTDDTLYADVQATAANLKDVTQRVRDGKGLLGKLTSEDDDLYKQAKLLLQDVRAAVDDLRETEPILTFTSILFGGLK